MGQFQKYGIDTYNKTNANFVFFLFGKELVEKKDRWCHTILDQLPPQTKGGDNITAKQVRQYLTSPHHPDYANFVSLFRQQPVDRDAFGDDYNAYRREVENETSQARMLAVQMTQQTYQRKY